MSVLSVCGLSSSCCWLGETGEVGNWCSGDARSNMSEEDDDDFYDAMSEQTEEIMIALPSDKKAHQ